MYSDKELPWIVPLKVNCIRGNQICGVKSDKLEFSCYM